MQLLSTILVVLIGLEHVYILVLEMFWWRTPRAMRAFGTTPEFAQASVALAANQGLYNGFLAAGLFWGALFGGGFAPKVFFVACVVVAGVYGGLTANRRILLVQAAPATLALIVTLLAGA